MTTLALAILVFLNGQKIEFGTVQPFLANGTLMVPLRAVCEKIGARVEPIPDSESIEIHGDEVEIEVRIGNERAYVKNRHGATLATLQMPALTKKGRTFVPLRFITQSFDAEVTWENATRIARITMKDEIKNQQQINNK